MIHEIKKIVQCICGHKSGVGSGYCVICSRKLDTSTARDIGVEIPNDCEPVDLLEVK